MEITLIINKEVIALGGLTVPAGSKAKVTVGGLQFNPEAIGYRFKIYANQEQMDADNPFVLDAIKGQPQAMSGSLSNQLTDTDMNCSLDSENCSITFTKTSITNAIKGQLATLLNVQESDIV